MKPAQPKWGFGVVKWNETIYELEKGIPRKTKKRYVDVISLRYSYSSILVFYYFY